MTTDKNLLRLNGHNSEREKEKARRHTIFHVNDVDDDDNDSQYHIDNNYIKGSENSQSNASSKKSNRSRKKGNRKLLSKEQVSKSKSKKGRASVIVIPVPLIGHQ